MNKIEILNPGYLVNNTNADNQIGEMNKPIYSTDKELNCGVIEYNSKRYLLDNEDRDRIINLRKNFVFNCDDDIYPSYVYNIGRIDYLQFIFGYKNNKNVNFHFKNNNVFDLRKDNVVCYHEYHEKVCREYNVIEYIPGHYSKNGVEPYSMKNPIWKVILNNKEVLLMYCEKNTLCILCDESYKKILDFEASHNCKLTFYKHSNDYILCTYECLFIHQIITGCYGNGKGTKNVSVDHIDRNKLNNTFENLRIATRKEQESNTKGIAEGTKRERKHSAKPLPEGLKQDMMRKYVVYYHEWLNPERSKSREYFKIEKHPKLEKMWVGTKSNKVSLFDKLAAVNKYADELLLL